MQELKLWTFIKQKLEQDSSIALMLVPQSIGSSPGRQGHKMAVAQDGEMLGTIGGGAMEYKQVEACKKHLKSTAKKVLCQRLIHDKSDKKNWSGLSCSGEQTVITYFLNQQDLPFIFDLLEACKKEDDYLLVFSADNSIRLEKAAANCLRISYQFTSQEEWVFKFVLNVQEKVYIIGAGHVGLALCRQLALLDFQVILIDNRADLPTKEYDQFIAKKIIVKYKKVATFVPSTVHDYIVIMTFSSALDSLVLSQLIAHPCRYIGLMASKTKAERIRNTILQKGFSKEQFERVNTPIGLPIKCKSPAEIAVSVAAQIIQARNI